MPVLQDDLRVCFIADSWVPEMGGGTKRQLGYFPGLRERKIQPEVFSGTPKASKVGRPDLREEWTELTPGSAWPKEEEVVDGVPIAGVRLPNDLGRQRTSVLFCAVLNRLRNQATQPDVLNLLPTLTRYSLPWVRKLRLVGLPMCYTLSIAPRISGNWIARTLRRRMLRRHYELMHAIIVQSVSHERWLREIGYSNHIAVIPNGVDAERFRPPIDHAERIRLRERLGFAPDVFIILTIGAVSPRKGTDLMIEAMGRISPRFSKIQLVVLGWRTDEMKNKLGGFRGKLAKLLGDPLIAERVRFEGVVDNVEEYLRAADIFLFASEREGLPNSLLEAMASRLPVITTDFIGLDVELGEPGCHYRLAERSPEGLACAVSDLLEDQSRREQLAEEGLRLVLATMRMDLALDRFGALYRRLVDKSAGC